MEMGQKWSKPVTIIFFGEYPSIHQLCWVLGFDSFPYGIIMGLIFIYSTLWDYYGISLRFSILLQGLCSMSPSTLGYLGDQAFCLIAT